MFIYSFFLKSNQIRETYKLIPVADFSLSSIDGLGFGAVGDNSNLNRRSSEDKTTFSSAMAQR